MVPEGRVLHRVLSRQGDAAEQNEEEDQVGEDRVIDNAVALEAEPAWGAGEKEGGASGGKGSGNLGPRSPGLFPWLFPPPRPARRRCSLVWGVGSSGLPLLGNEDHDPHPHHEARLQSRL